MGLPILVVDDNEFIRASMIKFLEGHNYKAKGVEGAKQAIESLGSEQYSLIITDILMPDMDGFELIDHVREGKGMNASVPIIAISGGGRAVDASTLLQSLEEKVDYVLRKPFTKKDLLDKVGELLAKNKEKAKA
jgi:CheY-like chemotaxis protein